MIFLLYLSIPIGIDPVETNEALTGQIRLENIILSSYIIDILGFVTFFTHGPVK
jgi:hypothetical protein